MENRAERVRGDVAARGGSGSELRELRRRLRLATGGQRRDVTRHAALPCVDPLAVLEAGQLAHDDGPASRQADEPLLDGCKRDAHLLGNLQVEPLPMCLQALQDFDHDCFPGNSDSLTAPRRCRRVGSLFDPTPPTVLQKDCLRQARAYTCTIADTAKAKIGAFRQIGDDFFLSEARFASAARGHEES